MPILTLSLPERPHRAVQEEASARARETGARLGRRRVRMGPGAAAGVRSGSGSRARPAPPAPARAGHVVPSPPARWDPGGGPSASAAAGPRTAWGEGRGPAGRGPVGGARRRATAPGTADPQARARSPRPPAAFAAGSFPKSRSGWGRRTAEAAASRPQREAGPRAGRCALRDLLLARVRMPGVTEAGVRLALFTHRVKQYPVPAREMQTPEPRGVVLRCP